MWSQNLIGRTRLELRHANLLRDLLEQDLDKDTAAGCGLVLVEVDRGQAVPAQSIHAKHVSEQHGNVAQLVVLVSVNRVVVLGKSLLKQVAPQPVDLCEALANQTEELGVRLFLRATLDDHGW